VTEEEARARAEAAGRKADGDIKVADEIAGKRAEEARAQREEARLKAEITVPAEVERQRVVIAAQAEREKAATVARGEAEARLANAKAEAEGTQAILDAKARGYQNLVQAVGGGQVVGGLLLVENIQSLARIQADAIAHLPIEKIVVWDGGGEGGGLARVGRQIGAVIPPLHELAKQVGLELPEFLGRLREDPAERPAREAEAQPAIAPAADGTLPLR
jgi:flotillin